MELIFVKETVSPQITWLLLMGLYEARTIIALGNQRDNDSVQIWYTATATVDED